MHESARTLKVLAGHKEQAQIWKACLVLSRNALDQQQASHDDLLLPFNFINFLSYMLMVNLNTADSQQQT